MTSLYYWIIIWDYVMGLYCRFVLVWNYITESNHRYLLRNYITELYHRIELRNYNSTTTTTIFRQTCSTRSTWLVHPNPYVATHHPSAAPSEPRDLPDSPEDPPGVYPGNLPGHFLMCTLETPHNFGGPSRHGEEGAPYCRAPAPRSNLIYIWYI